MNNINDGGAAFPIPGLQHDESFNGMTLRDFFASTAPFTINDAVVAADLESSANSIETAVVRVLNDHVKRDIAMSVLATLRYEYADAMLTARQGGAA